MAGDRGACSNPRRSDPANERLTDDGKARLDAAIGPFLDRVSTGVLMVEGYAQRGTSRMSGICDRACGRRWCATTCSASSASTPQTAGVMPLGRDSAGSPNGAPWDGVALAFFTEKNAKTKGQ